MFKYTKKHTNNFDVDGNAIDDEREETEEEKASREIAEMTSNGNYTSQERNRNINDNNRREESLNNDSKKRKVRFENETTTSNSNVNFSRNRSSDNSNFSNESQKNGRRMNKKIHKKPQALILKHFKPCNLQQQQQMQQQMFNNSNNPTTQFEFKETQVTPEFVSMMFSLGNEPWEVVTHIYTPFSRQRRRQKSGNNMFIIDEKTDTLFSNFSSSDCLLDCYSISEFMILMRIKKFGSEEVVLAKLPSSSDENSTLNSERQKYKTENYNSTFDDENVEADFSSESFKQKIKRAKMTTLNSENKEKELSNEKVSIVYEKNENDLKKAPKQFEEEQTMPGFASKKITSSTTTQKVKINSRKTSIFNFGKKSRLTALE